VHSSSPAPGSAGSAASSCGRSLFKWHRWTHTRWANFKLGGIPFTWEIFSPLCRQTCRDVQLHSIRGRGSSGGEFTSMTAQKPLRVSWVILRVIPFEAPFCSLKKRSCSDTFPQNHANRRRHRIGKPYGKIAYSRSLRVSPGLTDIGKGEGLCAGGGGV